MINLGLEGLIQSEISNEIMFWSEQMSEHLLFFSMGMHDVDFKKESLDLHNKWESFRKGPMKEEVLQELLPELKTFSLKLHKTLIDGKWLGWIFPLFIDHTIRELDYFNDKLNNKEMDASYEMNFWNNINGDHSNFAGHLMDPEKKNEKNIKAVIDLGYAFYDLETISESINKSKELDGINKGVEKGIKSNSIVTLIPPTLIAHVLREGQRSIKTLEKLSD